MLLPTDTASEGNCVTYISVDNPTVDAGMSFNTFEYCDVIPILYDPFKFDKSVENPEIMT